MSTATALAGTFNADPVHSSFGFAVKYQNVSLFRGTLDEVAATLVDGRQVDLATGGDPGGTAIARNVNTQLVFHRARRVPAHRAA